MTTLSICKPSHPPKNRERKAARKLLMQLALGGIRFVGRIFLKFGLTHARTRARVMVSLNNPPILPMSLKTTT